MKRLVLLIPLAAAVACVVASRPAAAQTGAQMRGVVVDEAGKPIPDVEVEIEYVGEGPKRVYHQKTNKKGGFVRVGLSPGNYKIYLSKPGYKRYGIDTYLSLGGLSDICGNNPGPNQPCDDIVLKAVSVAEVIPGGALTTTAAAPGGAPQPSAEEVAKLGAAYKQAVEAIKTSQWDVAETALKEVLATTPDQPKVHLSLGHVYREKKDYASAESEFKRVTELEPASPDGYIALAALYEAQGKTEDAVDFLSKSASSFEQDAKFQTALGATAMNAGRESLAEEAFTKVTVLDPANVEVQFHLASLALNRNETDDAIAHLEKYISAALPDSANVAVAKQLLATLQAKKK